MVTRNEFKLIKSKSIKNFEVLQTNLQNHKLDELSDTDKARLGFYFLGIACATGEKDFDRILNSIIDTHFCGQIFNEEANDYGIDAVLFDEEPDDTGERTINLFNFKFRENFREGSIQHLGDIDNTMKFFTAISQGSTEEFEGRPLKKLQKIIECLDSQDMWNIRLFHISNESNKISNDESIAAISRYQQQHDFKYIPVVASDILTYLDDRPSTLQATFVCSVDDVLSFEEDQLSSSKSYLARISIAELIRITSQDFANEFALSDYSTLKNAKLNFKVLYDNVRGYLGERTTFNKGLKQTLENEPSHFFMYNNGITIITKSIRATPQNGNKKLKIVLDGFQVVNGGQTLRTIYNWKDAHFDEDKMSTASVLVRCFNTGDEADLSNRIAEYTNSQSSINPSDLKSIDPLQIEIEKYLADQQILYVRKVGDTGDTTAIENYTWSITMEKLAQILYTLQGHPERVGTQKKKLFTTYYDEIFNQERFDFNALPHVIKQFHAYAHKDIWPENNVYDQKVFYAMYIGHRLDEWKLPHDLNEDISLLERTLQEYRKDDQIAESRKILNITFKERIDQALEEEFSRISGKKPENS